MRHLLLTCIVLAVLAAVPLARAEDAKPFVRVSPRDPRYLEFTDGKPYIPIGLNIVGPPGKDLSGMEVWFQKLSKQGGNYVRVWLSTPFFDIEHEKSGVYDEVKAKRIDDLLALARKYDLRVKMCLEHFRAFDGRQSWANKPLHSAAQGGPAQTMDEFFTGEKSRAQFKAKLAWYAGRYGDDPHIYAWELWNEINAVQGGNHVAWTKEMLGELHRLFPKNLAVQSLGSFDNERTRDLYRTMSTMPGNDVAQVHRYLDLGAQWEVCHGPVDVLAAEAVRELASYQPGRPVVLAESGAVEKSHSGPFKLYAQDKAGTILHDVLFAPFFAGAAGGGQIWHWDQYVDRNDLWWQFGRFAAAVRGLDPPAERFVPVELAHDRLRVLALKGQRTLLVWCRDKQNPWTAELQDGQPPQEIRDAVLDLGEHARALRQPTVRFYDPWADRWTEGTLAGGKVGLPAFTRSLVVRIERDARP